MKQLLSFIILGIAAVSASSCKKSNDASNSITNWNEYLKNTVWAGEFRYTKGSFTGLQPFSIELNADGTVSWTDVASTRPGGVWTVKDSVVTLVFPNMTSNAATLSKDKWSKFTNPAINGFDLANLSLTAIPVAEQLNTHTWIGKYGKTADIILHFLQGQKMSFLSYNEAYTIHGAGVICNRTVNGFAITTYCVFTSSIDMIGADVVHSASGTDQFIPIIAKKE